MHFFNETHVNSDKIMWDLWLSRYHLPLVAVSDKLGFFSHIRNGASTTNLLAQMVKVDIRGIEAATCLLASLDLLDKTHDKLTLNHISTQYLLPTSPQYWGPAFSRIYESIEYARILETFQEQQKFPPVSNGKSLTAMWTQGSIDIDAAKTFTQIMHCTILPSALQAVEKDIFKGVQHLLDVGGGSGCFASAFVKKYPHAKATIFELPAVCEAAKSYLKTLESLDLIELFPGNFFQDPLPSKADAILFSNIFHDWPREQALFLAKQAFLALPKNGKIFIHEMLLNEAQNGPVTPATFNLLMYINHGSQQFTENGLFALLQEAGFENCQRIDTHFYYSIIIGEKRK